MAAQSGRYARTLMGCFAARISSLSAKDSVKITGCLLSDFANKRNYSSVQPKPRSSRIFSGVCVQRLPVITKEKSELEKRYEALQEQLELEHSALSEDEVQWKEIVERKEKHKDDDDDESIAIAISESERKVASRSLSETCGTDFHVQFLSNAPIAVMKKYKNTSNKASLVEVLFIPTPFIREQIKHENRKQRLCSSLLNFEKAKLLKMKAQMEQQIQALEEQIILEKHALIDRSNRLQQLVKCLSSPEINKLAEQRATSFPGNESEQSEAPDLPQSNDSESQRLMREACQFAQFLREHPLEKWTVEKYAVNIVEKGTRFTEDVEVDEDKQTEVFRVPKHNNADAVEIMNDFIAASMQSSVPDVVTKSNVWKVVGFANRSALSEKILEFCYTFLIYEIKTEEISLDILNTSLRQVSGRVRSKRHHVKFELPTYMCRHSDHVQLENCLRKVGHYNLNYQCKHANNYCHYTAKCYRRGPLRYDYICTYFHYVNLLGFCCTPSC
ncbi:hypothetical protein ACROYT_G033273 [Oculina patagonica]